MIEIDPQLEEIQIIFNRNPHEQTPDTMIPAVHLNKEEFYRKVPPGGKGMSSTRKASKARGSNNVNTHTHPILNDIPTVATSCLIYKYSTLQSYIGDSTYPIPTNDEFKSLRQLKSLQAVAKEISDGNVVVRVWLPQ